MKVDFKREELLNLDDVFVDEDTLELFPENFCIQNKMLPSNNSNNCLTIISEEENLNDILEEIKEYVDFEKIILRKCKKGLIINRVKFLYKKLNFSLNNIDDDENVAESICDKIILDAFNKKASDIHFCPGKDDLIIKYRIDGALKSVLSINKAKWPSISIRIKILSELDISENRIPQDGSFSKEISGKKVDFRVSCHPTMHGENIVIRVLGNSKSINLYDLNYSKHVFEDIVKFIEMPSGLVVFTGPVGSGKTTALYSILSHLDPNSNNIVTLEDPIECYIPFIRQTDINKSPNMTFASGIKSLLRQDPNIMLIGEIRDANTAQMVMRAAMTGHKVFTTMHANNLLGVFDRLVEFGLEKSLIAQYLNGVVSQRLVRELCSCKLLIKNDLPDFLKGRIKSDFIFKENGCENCDHEGFSGRLIVAESVYMGKDLVDLSCIPEFVPMHEDAVNKIIDGKTTFSEVKKSINII